MGAQREGSRRFPPNLGHERRIDVSAEILSPMVKRADQTLRADGKAWDLSEGPNFDFAQFFHNFEDQEMLQISGGSPWFDVVPSARA
jgi:hypothetical protein